MTEYLKHVLDIPKMFIEIMLVIIIILLIILIFLSFKKSKIETKDVELAISNAWIKLGFDEKLAILATYAKNMQESYKSFEQLLRVPIERASLGELSLETILSDQLPKDMFGIRQKVLDGKIPDAHIKSTVGIICIDAKFPLDNYRKMLEADDPKEKEYFKKQFLKDVQGHLKKVADDYVCPQKGSAEFAFVYIPSENIYWFLTSEAFEMLRDYAQKGVQVVSPLTFSHKIELIKAGVHAKRLSQEAEKVKNALIKLGNSFDEIDEKWRIFYQTHLRNLENKAEELNVAYKKLKEEFENIKKER